MAPFGGWIDDGKGRSGRVESVSLDGDRAVAVNDLDVDGVLGPVDEYGLRVVSGTKAEASGRRLPAEWSPVVGAVRLLTVRVDEADGDGLLILRCWRSRRRHLSS